MVSAPRPVHLQVWTRKSRAQNFRLVPIAVAIRPLSGRARKPTAQCRLELVFSGDVVCYVTKLSNLRLDSALMRRAVRNIFRLHLEQPQTGRKMQATVYLPTRRRMRRKDSPKLTSVWVSKYTVNLDGRKQRHEAFGEDWLQALLMAVEGVRLRLPPGEERWSASLDYFPEKSQHWLGLRSLEKARGSR